MRLRRMLMHGAGRGEGEIHAGDPRDWFIRFSFPMQPNRASDASMNNPVNFARRFAHLVWLIIHEPGNVDEQKGTLRAIAAQVKEGAYHLAAHSAGLTAND